MFAVFDDAIAARRAALDRRSVPRRARDAADRGIACRDRGAPAERRARARRPADHGRGGADEVPGEGGERRREARRAARRRARPRARLPPSARGRAALGRRAGDGPEAARGEAADGRGRRRAQRGDARRSARPRARAGSSTRCHGTTTRGGCGRAAPRLDRCAACARPLVDLARGARRHARGARRPHHPPDAGGRAGRANRRPAASLRRLLAGDAQSHAAAPDGADARDSRDGAGAPRGGAARRSRRRV